MIPQRALTGTIEISTGVLTITSLQPAYTGESMATGVEFALLNNREAYTPADGAVAEMYLYYQGSALATQPAPLLISGSTLTGDMTSLLTRGAGYPLLVVTLMDRSTGALIVTASAHIQVTRVSSPCGREPSAQVVYIGRSPYIDMETMHWMVWDAQINDYVDSGVIAYGDQTVAEAAEAITAAQAAAGGANTAAAAARVSALAADEQADRVEQYMSTVHIDLSGIQDAVTQAEQDVDTVEARVNEINAQIPEIEGYVEESGKNAELAETYYQLSKMQAATGGFLHLVNKNGRIYCVRTANCGLEMIMDDGRLYYGYTE